MLWQGHPLAGPLAQQAYGARWVLGYLLLIALWRAGAAATEGGAAAALAVGLPCVVLAVAGWAVMRALAWVQARGSVYTLTDQRVILRVGAALPVTYTIPFRCIAAAHLDTRPDGSGTIALELTPGFKISAAVLWPHMRPWHLRHPQPALRCIADAVPVARLLAETAQARLNEPVVARAPQGAALAAE